MKATAESVIKQIHQSMELINKSLVEFPWERKEYYANWLAQTYHYVWRSTRFAALASAKCTPDQDFFHYEFIKGVQEEKGHDLLAENDLKALGYKVSDFSESPATSCFYQTLTYLMDYESHFSKLGYSSPLEGAAGTFFIPDYERVKKAFGPKAVSFLRVHCEVDQRHFGEALDVIRQLPTEHLLAVEKAAK